jgi:hypothetical protein
MSTTPSTTNTNEKDFLPKNSKFTDILFFLINTGFLSFFASTVYYYRQEIFLIFKFLLGSKFSDFEGISIIFDGIHWV